MSNYSYVSEKNLLGYQKYWTRAPHEWQADRVMSRASIGHLQGIDWKRHRETRLAKLQEMLKKQGCGAMLCTMGENVNYATGTSDYIW